MTVRLAAVGLGGLGRTEAEIYNDIQGATVVCGADVGDEPRAEFEQEFGVPAYENYDEMLEVHGNELDAVSIVTPHTFHYEQAMAAMERGLSVFVEKPMATDVGQAVSLVETGKIQNVVLHVGYQRHYHPAFEEIRTIVSEGEIGDIHMVNCFLGQDWISTQQGTWRTTPDLSGGGQLYDSGSHLLDALLWTTETTPKTVSATMDRAGYDVDINTALAATLERDGRPVTASIGVSAKGTNGAVPEEGMFIWGTRGRLAYDGETITVERRNRPSYTATIDDPTDFETLTTEKLSDFVSAVESSSRPAVPGSVGIQVTAFTEAAYDAAERGTVVDVQELIRRAQNAHTPDGRNNY